MMVAKQPAMPVVMPAATIMPVSGMVVARMGIMTAAMACVRPAGGLPGVRMLVTSAVRAVRGWGAAWSWEWSWPSAPWLCWHSPIGPESILIGRGRVSPPS
ncbi:hypothetical protein [Komagataeibacter nataicola]|uniref:hypothetical protein n=1 Tax=Komagataeibacter nataicola TaxID=265960 RepID=UPI0038D05FFF